MTNTTFATPGEDRYFEDYALHSVHQFGPISLDRECRPQASFQDGILEYPGSSEDCFTSRLIKGGWDRDSVIRMLAEYYLPATGDPGRYDIEGAEWKTAVLPGQELIVRVTVIGTERLSSKPRYGKVTSLVEVLKNSSEVVASIEMRFVFPCAPF